jgi:HSP20 family protein
MTRTAYDPFTAFLADSDRLFHEVDRIWRGAAAQPGALLNVHQDDDRLVVTTELPGVDATDVEVALVGDTLTINARRPLAAAPEGGRWLRRERQEFTVRRAVQLPVRVQADSAQAQVKDGLLTITLTRAAEDRPRAITVKAA